MAAVHGGVDVDRTDAACLARWARGSYKASAVSALANGRLSVSGIGLLVGLEGQQRGHPIFAKQLDWMLGSLRTIAAG
ncbi:hypothetical protein ACZ75_12910 [Massilia sp. NR 4-1]|nr:hypothetical protein ACZ75_12910 [Massilia sp. NR 4-1]